MYNRLNNAGLTIIYNSAINLAIAAYEVTKPNIPILFSLAVATRHAAAAFSFKDKTLSLEKNSTLTVGTHDEGSIYNNQDYIFLTSGSFLRKAVFVFLSHSLYCNVLANKDPIPKSILLLRLAPITLFALSTIVVAILEEERVQYFKNIADLNTSPNTKIEEWIKLVQNEAIRDHSVWRLSRIESIAVTLSTFTNAYLNIQISYTDAADIAEKLANVKILAIAAITKTVTEAINNAPENLPRDSPVKRLTFAPINSAAASEQSPSDDDASSAFSEALKSLTPEILAAITTGLEPVFIPLITASVTIKSRYVIITPIIIGLLLSVPQLIKTIYHEGMLVAQGNNLVKKAHGEFYEIMAGFGPMKALEKLSESFNCGTSFDGITPANATKLLTAVLDRKCEYIGITDKFISSVKAYSNAALVVIQDFANQVTGLIYLSTALELIQKYTNNVKIFAQEMTVSVIALSIELTTNEPNLAEQTDKNAENSPIDEVINPQQDDQQCYDSAEITEIEILGIAETNNAEL